MSTTTIIEQVKAGNDEPPVGNGSETPPTEYPGPPQQDPKG